MEWIEVSIDKDWLTVADVADYMEVSPYVVASLLRDGVIPAVKMGREWRVARLDLETWLNAQRGVRG